MTTNSIIPVSIEPNQSSPFDTIRRYDEKGNEFWKARELQKLLGYIQWRRFEDAIDRAKVSLLNQGLDITNHIADVGKLDTLATLATPKTPGDYKLSRHACYTIAMNGDPRKIEIAQAQSYFVAKTREAEVRIPQLESELDKYIKLEELRARNKELDNAMLQLHGREVVLALAGKSDVIVRDEVKVTEVINLSTGITQKFLSADQLKSEVHKRTGQKLKTLKTFTDSLRKAGRDDLLIPVTRPSTSEYIAPDRLDEAITIVYGKQRQTLIGE